MLDPMQASPLMLAPHALLPRYYADERQKRSFIRNIFDSTAADYDGVERAMALGTGSWYRRQALQRAGLKAGMKVLDVAVGTGLVAREAMALTGNPLWVVGVDPSEGMLDQAVQKLGIRAVRGTAENLPLSDSTFEFLSMGYALRHLSDLMATFREFHRVLRPGGRVCILEITRPAGRLSLVLLRWYMRGLVPMVSRLTALKPRSPMLWEYYWDTIEACVSPVRVMQAMRDAGLVDVEQRVEIGLFSEFTGRKAEEVRNPKSEIPNQIRMTKSEITSATSDFAPANVLRK